MMIFKFLIPSISLSFLSLITLDANASNISENLLKQCASSVPKNVALAIISQESGFNPYAIGVNRAKVSFKKPKNQSEAIHIAKKLIEAGHNIDMGYAQINSANLKVLKLSVNQVFDPCTNLKAMQFILNDCYSRAKGTNKLQKAFSCYNTGNYSLGFKNGYVNKVSLKYNSFLSKQNNSIDKNVNLEKLPNGSAALAEYANMINNSSPHNAENNEYYAIANGDKMLENNQTLVSEYAKKDNSNFGDIFSKPINDAFY